MLSLSSPAPTCLRCQLRWIIRGLERRRVAPAHLANQRRRQCFATSTAAQVPLSITRSKTSRGQILASYGGRYGKGTKVIHPHGRVIGKPGRRQREEHQSIPTTSLGKPSAVVLMTDLIEEPIPRDSGEGDSIKADESVGKNLLTPKEIEAAITGKHQTPAHDEVYASIEAMRPSRVTLEDGEFNSLVKELTGSFNARQLAGYLVHAVGRPSSHSRQGQQREHSLVELVAPWRPGVAPLEQRLDVITIKKEETGNTKLKMAQQIARRAWRLNVHSEAQQDGELEMQLKDWSMTMLFKLQSEDGVASYRKFLGSPLLARATTVSPHWPSHRVRIGGRRHVVEEAARQISKHLAEVGTLEVDMEQYKHSLRDWVPWRATYDTPFRQTDLDVVGGLTNSVLTQNANTMTIYATDKAARENAKRLALSLLDLPSPRNSQSLDPATGDLDASLQGSLEALHQDTALVEFPGMGMHQRFRDTALYRLSRPGSKGAEATSDVGTPTVSSQESSKEIGRWLTTRHDPNNASRPKFTQREHSPWASTKHCMEATYCTLLLESDFVIRKNHSARFVRHHQTPGLAQLLACFNVHCRQQSLVACLMPATAGHANQKTLPRINIPLNLSPDNVVVEESPPYAEVLVDETLVQLPPYAIDLVFTTLMKLKVDARASPSTFKRFKPFIDHVRASVKSGTGTVSGQSSLTVPLPKCFIRRESEGGEWDLADVQDVEYLLEYFVQRQIMCLAPKPLDELDSGLAPEAREILADWPSAALLECAMVDAGIFGGRRTELKLMEKQAEKAVPLVELSKEGGEDTDADVQRFIEAALQVPRLVTMASHGTLFRKEGVSLLGRSGGEKRKEDSGVMAAVAAAE